MKLIEIKSQSRRDFEGLYQCEKCGNEVTIKGYDDRNYHDNVSPNIRCRNCGESTLSLGLKPAEIKTKYERWEVV